MKTDLEFSVFILIYCALRKKVCRQYRGSKLHSVPFQFNHDGSRSEDDDCYKAKRNGSSGSNMYREWFVEFKKCAALN